MFTACSLTIFGDVAGKETPVYFDLFLLSFKAIHFKLDDRHVSCEVCIRPKEKSLDVSKDLVVDDVRLTLTEDPQEAVSVVFKSEVLKLRRDLSDALVQWPVSRLNPLLPSVNQASS